MSISSYKMFNTAWAVAVRIRRSDSASSSVVSIVLSISISFCVSALMWPMYQVFFSKLNMGGLLYGVA